MAIIYAYVKSNSLKYTDPFGLRARSSCYNLCGSNVYFYNPYKSKEEPSLSNHVVGSDPVNSLLENTHTALDVAGLSPSVSIIPDVINAVIHTIEGDFTNAGISGVVAIPFFGQGVMAIKHGAKAASINRIFDKYLKSKGLDAHKIKQYHLGRGNIAKYNLYVGKNTREVLIF